MNEWATPLISNIHFTWSHKFKRTLNMWRRKRKSWSTGLGAKPNMLPKPEGTGQRVLFREANIKLTSRKKGMFKQKNWKVFNISYKVNGSKLTRNKEVAKSGRQMDIFLYNKVSSLWNREGWHLCMFAKKNELMGNWNDVWCAVTCTSKGT